MANTNMQGTGMMADQMPNRASTPELSAQKKDIAPLVDGMQFQQAVSNLSAESSAVLEQHLTPPVKKAMAELFGPEVEAALKNFGPGEPTVNIPVSIVSQTYPAGTIEESIEMMGQDFATKVENKRTDPQVSNPQGLGSSPTMKVEEQTNVPPSMPMMA